MGKNKKSALLLSQPRKVKNRLEGAMSARRLRSWRPALENINSMIASGGLSLLARAREMVVNNGYVANAAEAFASSMVGDGIKPSPLIEDDDLRKLINRLWLEWTWQSDADGITDLYGQQAMIARELFVAGECFVRIRKRFSSDGLVSPVQIQLLQSELLSYETLDLPNGNRLRSGIEFDQIGKRVNYHFYKSHPGDSTDRSTLGKTIVPADEICHIYKPLDAGQVRGLSEIAPAMVKLFLLDQYDDAELDRKKTAAMFAGFVTSEPGEDVFDEDEDGLLPLEPGLLQQLSPGQSIVFSEPGDVGTNYEAFQRRVLLAASSAMRIPYHMVTNDVTGANYSSLRASLVDYRRRIGQLQYATIIHQFMRPIWGAFLEGIYLNGKLNVSPEVFDQIKAANFIPPKWDWVDPLKDISAAILEMKHGITSRRKVVESKGSDIEEIDAEVSADMERAKELGIQFGDQGVQLTINLNEVSDEENLVQG